MGENYESVKNFIEEQAIHEENPWLVLDYMGKPNYANALKSGFAQQGPQNQNAD